METNRKRQVTLQSGEALPVDLPRGARIVLVEGALLVQRPAEWLAGTFVLQPARRVAAPAPLARAELHAAVACGGARLVVQAPRPLAQRLGAVLQRLRRAMLGSPREPSLRRPA